MSELGQKLIESIRRAAAERPDYVYTNPDAEVLGNGEPGSCVYFTKDGCPSCIVGHGIADLGLINDEPTFAGDDTGIVAVAGYYEWDIDAREMDWLVAVQSSQDKLNTWGSSVQYADLCSAA